MTSRPEKKAARYLDRDKIVPPNLFFTKRAHQQLLLFLKNDPTTTNKFFRIVISGKGCNGFSYQAGFSEKREDDFEVPLVHYTTPQFIIMDPFSAFYLQDVTVDYLLDPEKDIDGFIILNHDEDQYHGKFWREDKNLIPPTL